MSKGKKKNLSKRRKRRLERKTGGK